MSPSTLVVEDFSALGQISMVAALSVLQAFNIETAAIPTSLLSTQTEGFQTPVKLNTQSFIKQSMAHWKSINDLSFRGALIGYLGSEDWMRKLTVFLTNVTGPIVIDPAMADQGKLYPGLYPDFVVRMRQFCQHADVITPNWTEICMLAGQNDVVTPDLASFRRMLSQLQRTGINASVVTTGIVKGGKEQVYIFDGQRVTTTITNHFPGHFYGAGDTFSALLMGNLLQKNDLSSAVNKSCQQLSVAIRQTSTCTASERRYGLKLGQLLKTISRDTIKP